MPMRPAPWKIHETCISDANGYPFLEAVCGRAGSPEISVDPNEGRAIIAAPAMYELLKDMSGLLSEIEESIGRVGCYGQMDRQLQWNKQPVLPRLAAVLKAVEGGE